MALLRLRKIDSAKEKGRFWSILFVRSTKDPVHRISIPLNCTTLKKNGKKLRTSIKSENPGKQKGGISPTNDSLTVDQNQWYTPLLFFRVWVVWSCGVFFVGFVFFGRRVADKLGEGAIYCDLMLCHSKVANCCPVSLNNQKRSLKRVKQRTMIKW